MPSSLTGPWTGFDSEPAWGGIHVDSSHVVGMVNALGVTSRPHSSPPAQLASAHHAEAHSRHHLPLRFTGNGFGYFRIWIVNLLLTTLTLGIFYPWARARRLSWYYRHTQLDGQPLDFHGKAGRMFDRPVLLWTLLLLGWTAQALSPGWALAGFALLALAWPYVYRAARQYQLSQTSWRGVRFRFSGKLASAYRAQLPLWAAALLPLALLLGRPEGPAPAWFSAASAATGLGVLLATPWLAWNLTKQLHGRSSLGPLKAHFHSEPQRFHRVATRVAGLALPALPLAAALAWLAVECSRRLWPAGSGASWLPALAAVGLGLALALGALALLLLPLACLVAGLQNLLWSHTGNSRVRFKSSLHFWPLWQLWLKNCALSLATLGLYWPFAMVAARRLRLEAVTLVTRIELDELVALVKHREASSPAPTPGGPPAAGR